MRIAKLNSPLKPSTVMLIIVGVWFVPKYPGSKASNIECCRVYTLSVLRFIFVKIKKIGSFIIVFIFDIKSSFGLKKYWNSQ